MSTFLKTIFQPLANRHYTDKKTSFIIFAAGYIPAVVICLVGAIFVDATFWLIALAIVASALIDYFLFDTVTDKIAWKLFWSNFYDEKHFETSAEHNAIKAYETDPSEANRLALNKHVRDTKQ